MTIGSWGCYPAAAPFGERHLSRDQSRDLNGIVFSAHDSTASASL
jgi:hypothetical protein